MKQIVIIEDEPLVYNLLQKKLSALGYGVRVAKGEIQGLNMIKEKKPDLLIINVSMPQGNGFRIISEMKRDANLKNIDIIAISNSGRTEEINKIKSFNIIDWIIKTEFDLTSILTKVKNQLGQS